MSDGGAELLDHAAPHDRDAVGERQRLDLVVGDVDHGVAEFGVQRLDLDAQLGAQLGVEVRQRLVEQEHVRPRAPAPARSRRAGAGRRRVRPAGAAAAARSAGFRAARPRAARSRPRGRPATLRPKRQVPLDRHARIERVGLEHHADAAVLGLLPGDVAAGIQISPSATSSRPAMALSRVDLPQPDGPSSTMNSPLAMSRSRCREHR